MSNITKKLKETGRHILTGERISKEVEDNEPVKKDWSDGRTEYTAHRSGTGSLNGRVFDFKAGDKVLMNEDEAHLFREYVKQ